MPPELIVIVPAPSIWPKFQLSVPPLATTMFPAPVMLLVRVQLPPFATVKVAPLLIVISPKVTLMAVLMDGWLPPLLIVIVSDATGTELVDQLAGTFQAVLALPSQTRLAPRDSRGRSRPRTASDSESPKRRIRVSLSFMLST